MPPWNSCLPQPVISSLPHLRKSPLTPYGRITAGRRAGAPVVHCYAMVVIFGIHAVSEALKSGARSFDYVGIARERHDQRVQRLIDDCRTSGVQVRFLPREQLDRTANTNTHQGVIAVTSSKRY